MPWGFSIVIALAASLMLAGASDAAPTNKKRQATHPVTRNGHGYGFLPGYRPPQRIAWERARARGPICYWDARAGYYRGRWNGGGFGSCWARTPIGPMWTCGR
jgi:hypothetical protein